MYKKTYPWSTKHLCTLNLLLNVECKGTLVKANLPVHLKKPPAQIYQVSYVGENQKCFGRIPTNAFRKT